MSVVANVAINVDSRGAVGKLRDVQAQAQSTERAFNGLGAAIGKLAIAATAIQAARFVFAKTAEIESQTRSLQVLTGSAQKAKQIISELQQLGAVTPFTSTELIDSAKRLQAFGVEAGKVVETTKRLADVSGATGAELQGLVTAYGQVQAKGRLQGEELLQFQERGVALQTELRKMYGLSGEEFQKALSKGQVSAKAVEVAIQRLTSAGGKYANGAIAQSDTLNGKLSTLQDSFQRLAQNIGRFFEPVFKFLLDGINAFLERVNSAAALQAQTRAYQQAGERTRARFGARVMNPFDTEVKQYRQRLEKSLVKSEMGALAPSFKPAGSVSAAPPLLGATGGGGRAGSAANEAKKLQDELQRSLDQGKQLSVEFSRQVMLLNAASETERNRLQIQFEYQDRQKQILELKDPEQRKTLQLLNDDIQRLETRKLDLEIIKEGLSAFEKIAGLDFSNTEGLGARAFGQGGGGGFRTDISLLSADKATQKYDEMKTKLDELTNPVNMAANSAQMMGNAFGSAFQNIITGAQSTQDALAGVFKNIGESFVNMATEMIAQMMVMFIFKQLLGLFGTSSSSGLFSGGGPVSGASVFGSGQAGFNPASFGGMKLFADGGFVTGPTRAMVGEGGEPEYIIPASKMKAAMSRYASGARGESVIPDTGGTVAGGTATATAPTGSIDIRYTVERINSVDYVTADQFQRGMAQAAQQGAAQGEQRTLRRLQQSRTTRSRLGMA